MKKLSKHKDSQDVPEVEQNVDVVALINTMQQQLNSLERKIDSLIAKPQERHFEEKHFSKPFQRFDRHSHNRFDRGNRDNNFRERSYTKVICADCGNECEVPFKPSADRPVYCKDCFSKRKEGGTYNVRHDNAPREEHFGKKRHFDKLKDSENRMPGTRKRPSFRKRKYHA
ncbi:MAG: hypothetical protein PHS93_01775 [Candidatus Omnitrophica bacterium]|nr:hypothetical protein [Candidatus Omnitrophota bacterium]MDD5351881.1 hypothetical protein [Candidatus Omnitrophota bacterium]MDD5550707.1 hypothetical protein [Candidatus Omnitrophota bacterium]